MIPALRSKTWDIIVVGAGHNGLTAAAYLARAGFSVLVLERREIVGGCCVTEEIAPGCRVSSTSYIASMLRPEVVRDLDLASHGLHMIPCDPAIQVAFPDGKVVPWWSERNRAVAEFRKFSPRDADAFVRIDIQLKKLARYLQPFFLEPPPELDSRSLRGWSDLFRVGKRFRGISSPEIARLVSFLTGSIGEFLDRNYESGIIKTLFLANNVYGKHGAPYDPGTASGLLFHLLSGGEHELQGYSGHVIGGMGSITQALAAACCKLGVEIRTSSPVVQIDVHNGALRGVILEDGSELSARCVFSNADPKHTSVGFSIRHSRHQNGRPLRQSKSRPAGRAALHRYSTLRHASGTDLLHACSIARIRRALLRHRQIRRYPRRTLGGLRCFLQRRLLPCPSGSSYPHLFRPIRSLPSTRRHVGREARTPRRSRRAQNRRVRS